MTQLIFPFALADFKQSDQLADRALENYIKDLKCLDKKYWNAHSGASCTRFDGLGGEMQKAGEQIIAMLYPCPYPDLSGSSLLRRLEQRYGIYRW